MSELLEKIERLGEIPGEFFMIDEEETYWRITFIPLLGRSSSGTVSKETGEWTNFFVAWTVGWWECPSEECRETSRARLEKEINGAIRALDRSEAIARFCERLWPFGGRS